MKQVQKKHLGLWWITAFFLLGSICPSLVASTGQKTDRVVFTGRYFNMKQLLEESGRQTGRRIYMDIEDPESKQVYYNCRSSLEDILNAALGYCKNQLHTPARLVENAEGDIRIVPLPEPEPEPPKQVLPVAQEPLTPSAKVEKEISPSVASDSFLEDLSPVLTEAKKEILENEDSQSKEKEASSSASETSQSDVAKEIGDSKKSLGDNKTESLNKEEMKKEFSTQSPIFKSSSTSTKTAEATPSERPIFKIKKQKTDFSELDLPELIKEEKEVSKAESIMPELMKEEVKESKENEGLKTELATGDEKSLLEPLSPEQAPIFKERSEKIKSPVVNERPIFKASSKRTEEVSFENLEALDAQPDSRRHNKAVPIEESQSPRLNQRLMELEDLPFKENKSSAPSPILHHTLPFSLSPQAGDRVSEELKRAPVYHKAEVIRLEVLTPASSTIETEGTAQTPSPAPIYSEPNSNSATSSSNNTLPEDLENLSPQGYEK